MNFDEIKKIIKSDGQILLGELNRYGSQLSRDKSHYNCCHCTSSDALSIKKNDNGYIYHCFSCGTGGDVIKLVQLQEGVNFPEAIKIICDRYGIDFRSYTKETSKNKKIKSKTQSKIEEYEKLRKEAIENKDFDAAIEYFTKINYLKENKPYNNITNKNNYSNYKADNTIKIKKYIGESSTLLMTTIIRALKGEKSLVIAPTGSGKTKETIDKLKEADMKTLFIVPNALNVEQIKQEYSIPGAWGDIPITKELEKGNLIAVTWDKFIQIEPETLADYIIVLDEVHQIYIDMFRSNKINKLYEKLNYCRGQIHITATPNKLNFEQYNYILEYEQENQTNYNVFLYNKINDKKIKEIAAKSTKFALFKNDKKYLDFIKDSILHKSIDVVTSDTRGFSLGYNEIVEKGTIRNIEGLCNTSVMVAGVNIYDKDITDIIIIGEKDIATIKQYIARFRDLKTVNVHIFNNYKHEGNIYEIEWLVQQIINEVSGQIEAFNIVKPKDNFILEMLNIKPIRLENSNFYYYNERINRYEVNEIAIRNHAYTSYYNNATIESYKELLEEYFKNIKIVELKETKNKERIIFLKATKEEKQAVLKKLEKNKEKLVGSVQILTDKTDKKLENYLAQNKTDAETEYAELLDLGIHKCITISNIAKILNLYTKYVIDDEFTYNIAWSIAIKGNRSRGKIFAQINNIAYRKIEKKYKDYIDNTNIETRLYNQIVKYFKPGVSYTTEHLDIFIKAFQSVAPIKLTVKQLQEMLNIIFKINVKEVKKVPPVDNIFLYKIVPTQGTKNKLKIFTVVDFTSLDDLVAQNNWSEIDKKILKNLINKNIRKIDKEVQKINYGIDIFSC